MAVDHTGISTLQNVTGAQTALYDRTNVSASSTELTMTDFYQLLAAQLKYQDADNPMDTSQMMAQMVQTQMITALTHMTTAISDLSLVNTTSYAVSMVGKEVTIAEVDENGKYTGKEIKGTVTGVGLGTNPTVFVDGKSYAISQLMSIGETKKAETAKPEGEKPEGSEPPKTDQNTDAADAAEA